MSRKPNTLELEKLQAIIVDALEDVKAQAITVIDTSKISDEFDRVVIATATSNRQTRALASNVQIKVKENGGDILSTEGEETGEWVLVDCGDIVVHLMQAPIRAYYNLEELWSPTAE
jgi:ribosome-associated protein